MKLPTRQSDRVSVGLRVTGPEYRLDRATGKKHAMIGFIDASANQRSYPCTIPIFALTQDPRESGELPEGLDRMIETTFRFYHKGKSEKVVGLDIIPRKLSRHKVIPVTQDGVKTAVVQFEAGGTVVRVTQRPYNFRAEESMRLIDAIDNIRNAGKAITTTMSIPGIGRVIRVSDNEVEVRVNRDQLRQEKPEDAGSSDDIVEQQEQEASAS